MKFPFLIFIILTGVNAAYSQDLTRSGLDSIYNKFIAVRQVNPGAESIQSISSEKNYIKCGFTLAASIKLNINRFTPQQQKVIRKILQRPSLQMSLVSPAGHFRIHFDTSGFNRPSYSVEQLAIAADSVYNFEVNILGYPPAPSDNGAGGDNLYDIYIINVGGEYGETDFENSLGGERYTTFQLIDNDFSGFFTQGINAAKVTVAHEYFHAIQIGNYIYREDDRFFYEISSTAMEDFVFTSINDYYAYLPDYFHHSDNSFACFDCSGGNQPYALGIWNIFIKDRFGFDIIKRQWELLPQMRALEAINNSLLERGSSLKNEFTIFGSWIYFTNYRSVKGKYFEEASNYPLLIPLNKYKLPIGVTGEAYPMSQNFLRYFSSDSSDTLDVIISNSDYKNGIDSLNKLSSYKNSVFNTPTETEKYPTSLEADNTSLWSETNILNRQIVKQDTTSPPLLAGVSGYVYPNPFFYSKNIFGINIPVNAGSQEKVDVNIYSSDLNLVSSFTGTASQDKNGNFIVNWDRQSIDKDKLPSGVYIFFTKSGDKTTTGKIVIFNE